MVFAQEAADHQHSVERGEIRDRHAQPRRAITLAVGAEIGMPQAEIDVVAAQSSDELLGKVHLFERRVRRSSEFSPSYENRSLSESQHSLIASFSSGTTRITRSPLTWTTRLLPRLSWGLTDLRR